MGLLNLSWTAEFFTKLSLMTLKNLLLAIQIFSTNFITKAFMLDNECNTIYEYPIGWPLGRTAK